MDNWVVVALAFDGVQDNVVEIFGTFNTCDAAEDFKSSCCDDHRSYEVRMITKPELNSHVRRG